MRIETVIAKSKIEAMEIASWATKIIPVESGEKGVKAFRCFESIADYKIAKKQR